MATLRNPRHEAFAQGLFRGLSADAAYQQAGFKANRGNAATLKAKQSIIDRVAELQGMTADRAVVDREWVLARLIENATTHQAENPAASNKALELIGKEIGMFVEQSINLNTNYDISDEPLTDDEWSDQHTTTH